MTKLHRLTPRRNTRRVGCPTCSAAPIAMCYDLGADFPGFTVITDVPHPERITAFWDWYRATSTMVAY